jgi:hypothetical protein
MSKVEDAVNRIMRKISDESTPDQMTVDESREFYESLSSWIDVVLDGLDDTEDDGA